MSALDILDWRVPIVDSSGRPTQEFMRKWAQQRTTNTTIPDLSTAAAVSYYLDLIANTANSILVRGTTLWGGFVPPADATKFLNGANPAAFAQVKDSDLSTSDITTNNVSTTKHGFCPKLPNDAAKFLDGTGAWSASGGGSGALTKISKVTTASSATTISFSSISATYSDLLLVIQGRSQTSALFENIHVVLNSDTSTNYNSQQVNIHATTLTGSQTLGTAYALVGAITGATATAAYAGQISLELANYAATIFNKTWTARNIFPENDSSGNTFVQTVGGMWKSTAAIAQIDITTASGSAFVDGTTAVLYGRG